VSGSDRITVRGHDLASEIIGQMTFTELMLLNLHGQRPDPPHVRTIDAVLVALMEHGLTPSTLATRLALEGAPESVQGAISAGLLAVGSRFLGVIEDVTGLLQRVVAGGDGDSIEASAQAEVGRLIADGRRVPGLGHNLLDGSDPRVEALLGLARSEGVAGAHIAALDVVRTAAVQALDRDLIVNATGAVGAILSDMGYPPDAVRGFALVSRCAGLFAHVVQERQDPVARRVWEQTRDVRTTE
jgi:citrate synthase